MALTYPEFCRWVDDHGPALYRTAARLIGDRHEAEDIVQETFRSAWKSRDLYRQPESQPERGERAWLVAILRRRVGDRWRKRRLKVVDMLEAAAPEAPARAEQDDYTDEVQRALDRLPPAWREVLLLVVVGELTHQEAADELGIPLGTVLSRVARARERMRQLLLQEVKDE